MTATQNIHYHGTATAGAETSILSGMTIKHLRDEEQDTLRLPAITEPAITRSTAWESGRAEWGDVDSLAAIRRAQQPQSSLQQPWRRLADRGAILADVYARWAAYLRPLEQQVQHFNKLISAISIEAFKPYGRLVRITAGGPVPTMLTAITALAQSQAEAFGEIVIPMQDSLRNAAATLVSAAEQFIDAPAFVHATDREIRKLVEQGHLRDARALASWASDRRKDSDLLARWNDVLRPATARAAGPASGRSRRLEESWLRRHSHEYHGQWVGVLGDRLIASSPRLSEVMDTVRKAHSPADVLLHFVPEPRKA